MKSKNIFSIVCCFLLCTLCDSPVQSQVGGKAGSYSYAGAFALGGQGGIAGLGGIAGRPGGMGGTIPTGGTCNISCIVTPRTPVCTLQNPNCGGDCKRNCTRAIDIVCTSLMCTCTTQTLHESYIDVTYITPTCTNNVISDVCKPIKTCCYGNVTVSCHKQINRVCNDNTNQIIEEDYTKVQNVPVPFSTQQLLKSITLSSKECEVVDLDVINLEQIQKRERIITCDRDYINSLLIPRLFWCDPRSDGNTLIPLLQGNLFTITHSHLPTPIDHKCGENVRQKIVMVLPGCN